MSNSGSELGTKFQKITWSFAPKKQLSNRLCASNNARRLFALLPEIDKTARNRKTAEEIRYDSYAMSLHANAQQRDATRQEQEPTT